MFLVVLNPQLEYIVVIFTKENFFRELQVHSQCYNLNLTWTFLTWKGQFTNQDISESA